ncbi:MAG: membrane fusion protein MtrC, partial [Nitrosomonas europaea]
MSMQSRSSLMTMALPAIFFLAACSGSQPEAAPDKPAKVEPIGHETNLLKLTLST